MRLLIGKIIFCLCAVYIAPTPPGQPTPPASRSLIRKYARSQVSVWSQPPPKGVPAYSLEKGDAIWLGTESAAAPGWAPIYVDLQSRRVAGYVLSAGLVTHPPPIKSSTDWTQVVLQLSLALAAGLFPILIWELVIKPRKELNNLVRTLRTEIILNSAELHQCEIVLRSVRTSDVWLSSAKFFLSHVAFNALVDGIAYLPSEAAGQTLQLYQRFEDVFVAKKEYEEFFDRYPLPESPEQADSYEGERRQKLFFFHLAVSVALSIAATTVQLLDKLSPPDSIPKDVDSLSIAGRERRVRQFFKEEQAQRAEADLEPVQEAAPNPAAPADQKAPLSGR
jgi:hypothetical protein